MPEAAPEVGATPVAAAPEAAAAEATAKVTAPEPEAAAEAAAEGLDKVAEESEALEPQPGLSRMGSVKGEQSVVTL